MSCKNCGSVSPIIGEIIHNWNERLSYNNMTCENCKKKGTLRIKAFAIPDSIIECRACGKYELTFNLYKGFIEKRILL